MFLLPKILTKHTTPAVPTKKILTTLALKRLTRFNASYSNPHSSSPAKFAPIINPPTHKTPHQHSTPPLLQKLQAEIERPYLNSKTLIYKRTTIKDNTLFHENFDRPSSTHHTYYLHALTPLYESAPEKEHDDPESSIISRTLLELRYRIKSSPSSINVVADTIFYPKQIQLPNNTSPTIKQLMITSLRNILRTFEHPNDKDLSLSMNFIKEYHDNIGTYYRQIKSAETKLSAPTSKNQTKAVQSIPINKTLSHLGFELSTVSKNPPIQKGFTVIWKNSLMFFLTQTKTF